MPYLAFSVWLRRCRLCLVACGLLLAPSSGKSAPAAEVPSAAVAAPTPTVKPRRLALLIGVGKYDQSGPSPWPNLRTHDEITELRRVLLSRYQFEERDVLTLEDESATGEAIRRAFRQHLIEQAQPGSIVYFHFSGHGQQLLDEDGDELDGLDESLVPHDAKSRRARLSAKINIRDDEIAGWLAALGKRIIDGSGRKGQILITFDSCFSGTATRGTVSERGRGWDELLDGPRPRTRASGDAHPGVLDTRSPPGLVFLSAAQSNQTAKEVGGMGVFTRALLRTLSENREDRRLTYRSLLERAAYDVAAAIADQTPSGEGELDQLVFEQGLRPPPFYVPVLRSQGNTIELAVGSIAGMTVGSIFQIYKAGSDAKAESERLASAKLKAVDAARSTAELSQPVDPQLLAGARAVLSRYRHAPERVRLRIAGPLAPPTLGQQLAQLPEVRLVQSAAEPVDFLLQADPRTGQLTLTETGIARPLPRPPDSEPLIWLTQVLRHRWRFRYLLRLRAPSLAPAVRLRVVPRDPQGIADAATPAVHSEAQTSTILKEGSLFGLELTNESQQPLYITVLQLSSDGDVSVLLPTPGQRSGLVLPADHQPHVLEKLLYRAVGPPGRLVLKLIATREPLQLSALFEADAQRAAGREVGATSTLSMLMAPVLGIEVARGERGGQRAITALESPVEETVRREAAWGTAESFVEVRSP